MSSAARSRSITRARYSRSRRTKATARTNVSGSAGGRGDTNGATASGLTPTRDSVSDDDAHTQELRSISALTIDKSHVAGAFAVGAVVAFSRRGRWS